MAGEEGENKLCGLIGYIGYEKDHEKLIGATVKAMGAVQNRGKDSWGIMVNGQLYRDLGEIDKGELQAHLGTHLKPIDSKINGTKPNFIIGHVRAKTVGSVSINNAHPFLRMHGKTHGPIGLAHNGTVTVEGRDCQGKFEAGESDTAKLSRAIAEHGFDVMKRISGTAAILAATNDKFFAYGQPLWRARTPYGGVMGYMFASTRTALDAWKQPMSIKDWAEARELLEDELFTLTPSRMHTSMASNSTSIEMKASYRLNANRANTSYGCDWGEWTDTLMKDDDDGVSVKVRTKAGIASTSGVPAKPKEAAKSTAKPSGAASVTPSRGKPTPTSPMTPALKQDTRKGQEVAQAAPAKGATPTAGNANPPGNSANTQDDLPWASKQGKKSEESDITNFGTDITWMSDIDEEGLKILQKMWENYLQFTPSLLMDTFFEQSAHQWLSSLVSDYTEDIWDLATGEPKLKD
jgi:hypothetical protein